MSLDFVSSRAPLDPPVTGGGELTTRRYAVALFWLLLRYQALCLGMIALFLVGLYVWIASDKGAAAALRGMRVASP